MTDMTVKVYLDLEERVRYKTTVDMPLATYKRLEKAFNDELSREETRRAEEIARDYIDPQRDWYDSGDIEVTDFRIAK